MARSRVRVRKLVPWYHQNKPRCVAMTGKKRQCANSASYVTTDIYQEKMCKTHRDIMILLKGWKFKLIRPSRINIDTEETTSLRSVG